MKYLIAGLGNIGAEYVNTRHNIGFDVADNLAFNLDAKFSNGKKAWIAEAKYRSRNLVIIKPTTYMNLSGEAIRYWLNDFKIPLENLLVIADDIALPFGSIRLRGAGGPAGHNGLINIIECLNTEKFARLRFGIGNDFPKGRQVDYVLGKWSAQEENFLEERIQMAREIVKSFVTIGIQETMNTYNNK